METDPLIRQLHREILHARQRIYTVGDRTPLNFIDLAEDEIQLFVKREDCSPIHAYKWRGAYNRMAALTDDERERGVVTASAGNHAQGVALAAALLPTKATVFMPLSTPRMKQRAVKRHGGEQVEIRLVGNSYDESSSAALAYAQSANKTFIHAYDDILVMGGQGTLADEVVLSGKGPFDVALLQVGGGGMAAAVSSWLKMHFPDIEIIGVEGVDQASMAAAIAAGEPVTLPNVDVFCDGTAVRRVGALTFPICQKNVDRWITVTNEEVSAAIEFLWEQLRVIPEPSGAMGVAGLLKERANLRGKRVLTILCGANMDFEQLQMISRNAAVGAARRRFLRMELAEEPGELRRLLTCLPAGVNIVDMQYGQHHTKRATPVIGVDASEAVCQEIRAALRAESIPCEEVTAREDVAFRVIQYDPHLFTAPLFLTIEFHERPGGLADLLDALEKRASICYFNYAYSGERVGRALVGFDFKDASEHAAFTRALDGAPQAYRRYTSVTPAALERILR